MVIKMVKEVEDEWIAQKYLEKLLLINNKKVVYIK